MRKSLLFILSMLGFAFGHAQQTSRGTQVIKTSHSEGKTYGLVIGISDYAELPKLNFADKDAAEFYRYLIQAVPTQDTGNLVLLLNRDATRDAIADRLYDLTEKVKAGDKVYVYFSGHGDMEQLIQTDNCLLLLSNSPVKNYLRKSNAFLDINLFREFFRYWSDKNVRTIFVSDACHSGGLTGGESGRKNTVLSLTQTWAKEIKLLSCQANEVSLEGPQWGGGRGLFSYYFILGLKGLADKDNNAEVSLFELDNFLRDHVSASSRQSQIPVVQGDFRAVVSNVTAPLLTAAKKEISKTSSDEFKAIALRGGDGSLLSLLKDSASKSLYLAYKNKLAANQLLQPENSSAYYYFQQLNKDDVNELVRKNMCIELIEALQKPFDNLLDYVYEDAYEKLGFYEKIEIEKQLTVALSLCGQNSSISKKIKSKLLFLQACELSSQMERGVANYRNNELMEQGISLLSQAIKIDPLSPNLYLRLGDYYLYSNQLNEAIKAYRQYQQLLPNDEHSYNKLGMAYVAKKEYDLAIEALRKAIRINPNYWQATENLRLVMATK